MKIRTNFVSNSSSSSFVILGTELTAGLKEKIKSQINVKEDDKYDDWMYDGEVEKKFGLSIVNIEDSKDGYVIGKIYADIGSDGDVLEQQDIALEEITESAEKIKKDLGVNEVKLMMGTRPC